MIRTGRTRTTALALAALATFATAASAAPDCESLAVFHTTCARCHEAECSGRVTFDDLSRASEHVRRYAGPLADARVTELLALLRVTKEACRIDADAAARCGEPPWDAARLRRVHVATERAWFVPLGAPSTGAHRVVLRFDRDVEASLQILTARFDTVHEATVRSREHVLATPFSASGDGMLFVRVHAAGEAELLRLEIETIAPP